MKTCSCTDVVYIDFFKAFDTVVIYTLLFKLECYDVTGLLPKLIKCFLTNRIQSIFIF
jgi:hypothetical protein